MTQAGGIILITWIDPALVIEYLNGYRLKESFPPLDEFTVPLGIPEILKEGTDITIVSWLCIAVIRGRECFGKSRISCEIIDVQTLLFDINHKILESSRKQTASYHEECQGRCGVYVQ
jgi:pyruvate/2-oxoglutarate/acetoin dehydrogenase E1 component